MTALNDSRQAARVGGMDVRLIPGNLHDIYGADVIHERHENRYEIEQGFVSPLESKGMHFTAQAVEGNYPEAFELTEHPFYVGVIYHPEFISRPNKAHPLFTAFIKAAKH